MSIITNEITSMPIKIWTSLLKKNRSHFLPLVLGFEKLSSLVRNEMEKNMELLQMHAYIKVLDV